MAKVLLAEDNETNRDMLSRRLARRRYQVVVAVDGAQAVAMAATEGPALILMDMSPAGHRRMGSDAPARGRGGHAPPSAHWTGSARDAAEQEKALDAAAMSPTPSRSSWTGWSARAKHCSQRRRKADAP